MKLHSLTTVENIVICKLYKFYLTTMFTPILISRQQNYADGTCQFKKNYIPINLPCRAYEHCFEA